MSNHSRAKAQAERYKNYQSTKTSEGWGGNGERKGDDNYIGPNELKAMQRDSGLSANEMNDFFSSEEGQKYFSNKHVSGGSGGKGGLSNSDYLAQQAQAETDALNAKLAKQQEEQNNNNNNNNTPVTNIDSTASSDANQEVDQNNDQSSTINGNNNTVQQTQDNSIRNYGGSSRSFVYNGSGSGSDAPVSAATMAGFYDVDDSPAANAKFNDFYNTINNDSQKRFAGSGMAVANMFKNYDARSFNPVKLQSRIDQSTVRSQDQATVKDNDVFGDRDLFRGTLPKYQFGESPKEVKYDDDDDD